MGLGSIGKGAPHAPDPYATANAQGQIDKETAAYNAQLNRVDTYTPYGNSTYTNTGTATDPHYRQDITLTPEAQQQVTNELEQNNRLSELGFNLSDQAKTALQKPISDGAQSRDAAANAYYQRQTAYLDPQFAGQQHDLDASLTNKGVIQGSEAYNRAQNELARQKEFSYGQARDTAIQTGDQAQNQQLQIAAALRTMPLNELNALRTGTQVNNPTFQNTAQATAQTPDLAGAIQSNYAKQVGSYNNFVSGLFSAAGSAAAASDRRLKVDVVLVGETPIMRLPLYAFRYIGGAFRHVGVMAQDVLRVKPAAVRAAADGFLLVDYAALA